MPKNFTIFLLVLSVIVLVVWKLQQFLAMVILSIILLLSALVLLYMEYSFLNTLELVISFGSLVIGIFGIIYAIRGGINMATLKSEKVVRQWGTIVPRGAGRDKWLLDTTETLIKEASPPAVVTKREPVTSGGLFSEKRDFLIVTHNTLREYAMFIGAQNFGKELSVAWYLTINPGFLKRTISKKISNGDPNALSGYIPVFAQQDLSSYVNTAHKRLQEVVWTLLEELKQDTARIDWSPKGFLSMW